MSTGSWVDTAQHGDHGFPLVDSSVLPPLQIDVTTRQAHHLTFKAGFATVLLPLGQLCLGAVVTPDFRKKPDSSHVCARIRFTHT